MWFAGRGESPQPRLKLETCFHSLIQISFLLSYRWTLKDMAADKQLCWLKRIPEMEASGGTRRREVFCSDIVTISYRILPILSHLFCVMSSKQRTNADSSLIWKLSQSCSDGSIYFDDRPPSECWRYTGTGSETGSTMLPV